MHLLCVCIRNVYYPFLTDVALYFLYACVDVMEDLYNYVNPLNKRHSPMISKETLDLVLENKGVSHIL